MDNELLFQVTSKLGKKIRVTKRYWHKLTTIKHPVMKNKEMMVAKTLETPTEIRQSKSDDSVFLYYRPVEEYYNTVVVKHLNGEGFIITTYITDKIKEVKNSLKISAQY